LYLYVEYMKEKNKGIKKKFYDLRANTRNLKYDLTNLNSGLALKL